MHMLNVSWLYRAQLRSVGTSTGLGGGGGGGGGSKGCV